MATVVFRKSRSGYRADIGEALLLERVYNVERGFGRRKVVVVLSKEGQIVDAKDESMKADVGDRQKVYDCLEWVCWRCATTHGT